MYLPIPWVNHWPNLASYQGLPEILTHNHKRATNWWSQLSYPDVTVNYAKTFSMVWENILDHSNINTHLRLFKTYSSLKEGLGWWFQLGINRISCGYFFLFFTLKTCCEYIHMENSDEYPQHMIPKRHWKTVLKYLFSLLALCWSRQPKELSDILSCIFSLLPKTVCSYYLLESPPRGGKLYLKYLWWEKFTP